MKVLLIEDDEAIANLLQQALVAQHYLVEIAADGQMGWDLAEAFEYDLILLNLMLPKLDGISFCQQLRSEGDRLNHNTPILLMTAQDASTNGIVGLDAGADDYILKPFDLEELLARVRALLRRGNTERSPLLEWQQLQLNPNTCQVSYQGEAFHLSAKEYKLLELFLRHPQRIFSHGTLIEHLWALEDMPTENAIRAQIKGLRKRLKQVGVEDCLETVYGLGYRLKEAPKPPISSQQTQQLIPEAISQFWVQYREQYCDRLLAIEQAVTALQSGTLDVELQQQALREAHTLKGSLGVFGLDRASELSHEIEQLLKELDPLDRQQQAHLSELTLNLRQALEQPLAETELSVNLPASENQERSLLLIVDDDTALAQQLAKVATDWNIQAELAVDLTQARTRIAEAPPDVVLLDLTFPQTTDNGFELLAELATQQPQLPVLVFTAKESFADRLKVAQLGGKGFLQKPITPVKVMEAIQAALRQARIQILQPAQATARLLIVDDDVQLLDILRVILQPWGFQISLLSNPQQFWHTLETVKPDLLILDIEMPEFNGIDLCQVVRNDLEWGDLPILILSAHCDDETVQQVFMAGADDYVNKPIRAAELIARVIRRLEHAKVMKKLCGYGERSQ